MLTLKRTILACCLTAVVLGALATCQTKPGIIFPVLEHPLQWPPPPDPTRIVYVGKLETSNDLKPGINGFEAIGQALFGKEAAHSMLTPMAVCTDGGNRVFVADSNAQWIHVFDLANRKYAAWKPDKGQPILAQPVGVAWDVSNQRLLVSDSVSGCLGVFDTHGHFTGTLGQGQLKHPVGIAIDNRPNVPPRIFVADTQAHQIFVFAPDGKLLQTLGTRGEGPGQFNFPTSLALAPSGQLYVLDALNWRVQVFDADLKPLRQFGKKGDMPGYFAVPKSLALDSEGHVYVVDGQFENVQIFDAEGHILMDFGEEGTGPGKFWLPTMIFIDPRDRIWVADSYNRRLQVFDYKTVPEVRP